ncbi:hypothetical protein J5N97_027987 [Dioscorea zingiberensis]|uniref:TRAF-type domain-containing protein n=1 Tax=Dioscorea zingiberensis TaxID=325984 RepID=A0A9D5H4A0_9LILI|nr:hypothetical protein J5N97_027987 [Dioscorea zingiberensis]
MELPASEVAAVKDEGTSFQCQNCDGEIVHKIAQLLLPGLAAACVDNTTGDPFKSPASVAVGLRKEMVDYLNSRSETFVAEFVVPDDSDPDSIQEIPEDPAEIVSIIMDDFAASKRSLLGRLSTWLLSESREDKIDDFVQEMEAKGLWMIDRREAVSEPLLRNVDFKNAYTCSMKFPTAAELDEHKNSCGFRPASCSNDGCKTKFCAVHADNHDAACPFKVLPCEQKCEQRVVRREMDRHCITVCPMRLINCPFYQIGCQSTYPLRTLEKHCSEFIHSHLLYVLQVIHRDEASIDELKERVQLFEKSQSLEELSRALDVRSLTLAVKEHEAKIKTLEENMDKVSLA